ncbi:MAG: helix-turn-helix domain-containing protein [Oscillospiraceae bacterium]|jgi:transcriptional regulator with XRE-family HTH domain|nr:helix-turn-helix domain-containing protein [Oscillospiraceae bacterium]
MSAYAQKPELKLFGERIALKRTERNLSQQQLADRIGIKRPALTKIEAGAQDMRIETLAALTKALNTSADYFIHGASAKSMDIYMTTGLEDGAIKNLAKWKELEEDFGDSFEDYPGRIEVLNEFLSNEEFYSLIMSFSIFRRRWGFLLTESADWEDKKKQAELYSKEYREASEHIRELREKADFLKWQFSQQTAAFTEKLLEVD